MLVREPNWLGDVVISLPALRAVRDAFPAARLAILIRRELADLFDGMPWLDEVIPYALSRGLGQVVDVGRIVRTLRARRFDLAILFPTSFASALWPTLARVPRRVGYVGDARRPLLTSPIAPGPEARQGHEVHWYLDLLRRTLGIEGGAEPVPLEVHAPHRERMRAWLGARRRRPTDRLVALAPAAAYGPAKEWPAARWAMLVDALAARDTECVLVGAPGERARCEAVASASRAGALVAAGETSIGELAGLLSLADGFAGNDSGAMHVAATLGRPTVGVFGSTAPDRTGPRGPAVRVLHVGIECSPCLARTCRFGHYECLTRIEPVAVLQALVDLGVL